MDTFTVETLLTQVIEIANKKLRAKIYKTLAKWLYNNMRVTNDNHCNSAFNMKGILDLLLKQANTAVKTQHRYPDSEKAQARQVLRRRTVKKSQQVT
ncbi:hypothetical protein PM082_014870 [Marasmius tenuissimus]|nr:hypothetical protein PM082_014870 [Marasmius tenuissimus]